MTRHQTFTGYVTWNPEKGAESVRQQAEQYIDQYLRPDQIISITECFNMVSTFTLTIWYQWESPAPPSA